MNTLFKKIYALVIMGCSVAVYSSMEGTDKDEIEVLVSIRRTNGKGGDLYVERKFNSKGASLSITSDINVCETDRKQLAKQITSADQIVEKLLQGNSKSNKEEKSGSEKSRQNYPVSNPSSKIGYVGFAIGAIALVAIHCVKWLNFKK